MSAWCKNTLFWFFLQSTEETAQENHLQILKRKNNSHKGETPFDIRMVNSVFSVPVKLSAEQQGMLTLLHQQGQWEDKKMTWLKNARKMEKRTESLGAWGGIDDNG